MIFNIQNIEVLDKLEERYMPIIPNNKGLKINIGNGGRLTLNGLIQELNTSAIFNPLINSVIPICFENFDSFGKVKTVLRNYFSKGNFESSIAHYSFSHKSISIFQGVMEPTIKDPDVKEQYIKLLNSIDSPDFIVKFFVFHEIGHAIHDALLKQESLGFSNISDYFNGLEYNNSLRNNIAIIYRENFADLFATIVLAILDNNPAVLSNINKLSTFRESITEKEHYQTFNSLNSVLERLSTKSLEINDFKSLLQEINQVTLLEIKTTLNAELENKGNFYDLNCKFGYLDSIFGLNGKDTKDVIAYLQEEINYNSPYGYSFHAESFCKGKADYLSEENMKTKISINNIFKIRAICVENNNYKNKNNGI